jgi:hypothetical protein
MKEQFEKLRNLIDEIEATAPSAEIDSFERNFDALELPQIVSQIVDFLQPRLFPYEAAIYWYLFRHSVIEQGTQYVRVSVRGLCVGVITSNSGQSEKLSYGTVQDSLRRLEEKGAIRKSGDTTREGTPYFIVLPEEIPSCAEEMRLAEAVARTKPIDEKKDLDFYNVAENRLRIFQRDLFKCYRCQKDLTRFSATRDHIQPVSKGGDHSYENLVTACLHCNSRRGNRPIMDPVKGEG